MLGFGSISSRSISGSPFQLITVTAALSATVSLTFGVVGTSGLVTPMSGSIAGLSFAVPATMVVDQAISATIAFSFDSSPTLRVAGKPIRINALPQSFTLRATQQSYTLKALPQSFTVRGSR